MDGYPKTAACACGALTATAAAPPAMVHACSCLECQRRSGSAFTYSAFFAEADVTIAGNYHVGAATPSPGASTIRASARPAAARCSIGLKACRA